MTKGTAGVFEMPTAGLSNEAVWVNPDGTLQLIHPRFNSTIIGAEGVSQAFKHGRWIEVRPSKPTQNSSPSEVKAWKMYATFLHAPLAERRFGVSWVSCVRRPREGERRYADFIVIGAKLRGATSGH